MAKPFRSRAAGLSLALILAQTVPLSAQSLLDAAPSAARSLPGESESILSTRPVPVEAVATKVGGLVPFEQALPVYHLSGEDAVARLSFNLAADQAASGGQLALSYRNAVSVLPDTSVMDVEVNGKPAGTFRIASPNGFKSEALPIGADFLKPGRNQVVLRARQFHRVDCSLEATYELWSELDPSTSGFAATRPHGFRSFDDLLTVARTDAHFTDTRLILPQAATAEMLNDAAPVLQTLALFLNRDDLAVTVGEKPGTGPGIDLYVSTDKTRAQAARNADGQAAPYGLSVRNAGTDGRAVVSLRGATRADISSQLLQAIQGQLKESLDSGIFSSRSGTIVAEASTTYTLADTGYETRVFSGRLSRTGFNMVMPADFYPADYATIGLKLSAATSPGLKRTAQFLVRVNDRVVTSYPFRNSAGEQFDGKLIELPLRAFRPGNNKVELLAELPVEEDATCTPEARNDATPRFILLKDTAIEVPALARIGRLPDIGALAGTAYPYADGRPFDIFVERPDAQSTGAALTMLSRLALAARNPLNAEIRLGTANPSTDRNALVITTQNAFADLGTTGKSGFPVNGFQSTAASVADVDPVKTATIGSTVFVASAPNGDDDSSALLDAFRKSTTRPQDALSVTSKLQTWFSGAGARFGKWLNYQDGSGSVATLKPGHSLLTLTQTPSPSGDAVWTVVHAGSPADIALGVRRLVEPAVWQGLNGGSAEIETASLTVNTVPAGAHFIAGMTDQSPSNIRRLAAAWFSDNFQFYVLLIVGLMGVFAVWLGLVIPRKGVRSDQ
ncbi:cellulose biosynthesis cyclic di-GMP-binding regulatory protein BcsB [Rhizobium herbae]